MAGTIYSVRLVSVHDQPGVVPVTFTVPAGKTMVVRDMDVYYGTALSAREVFAIGSAGQVFWQDSVGSGENGWRMWRGRQVFLEGEEFQMFGTDTVDMTASGYLLG